MCMCVTDMYCHVQAPTIKPNIRSHVPLYSGQQLQHQHAEPPLSSQRKAGGTPA